MIFELLIILVLIVAEGLWKMAETALTFFKKSKLEIEAERGDERAVRALQYFDVPEDNIFTLKTGVTIINTFTGVYAGFALFHVIKDALNPFLLLHPAYPVVAVVAIVIVVTLGRLLISELLPFRLGKSHPETIVKWIINPVKLFYFILRPFVWTIESLFKIITGVLGIVEKPESHVTEEEIKVLLDQASSYGEVEKAERDIVERVFFLGDAEVGTLMTQKMDVKFLHILEDVETIKKEIIESVHTNFPVYEENTDNIIGVLNIKKLVPHSLGEAEFELRPLLDAPLFVPDTMNAFKLLENMKMSNTHFAIVLDEYGSVKGVITNNDLFKAMVGNLYEDTEEPQIVEREDHSYLVDGLVPLDKFLKFFELSKTEEIEKQGFHTVGGLILYIAGHIPMAGEKLTWDTLVVEIVDMDGTRVDKVLVSGKQD